MSEDAVTNIAAAATLVDEETAAAEFKRFIELWDIDGDTDAMDEDSRDGFEDHRRKLVRGIRAGRIAIDDEGAVVIQLRHSSQLELTEIKLCVPTGNALLTWDKYKERQQVHKLNAFLASMSGQNPATFAKMDARDLKPAMAVATLFLAS